MNRKKISLIVMFSVLVFMLSASSALAGWVEVNKYTGTSYISDGMVKQVRKDEGESWSVFDSNKGLITLVEPRRKSYMEINPDELCTELASLMEMMMSRMPPEERAMMEKLIGDKEASKKMPAVSVDRVGKGAKIAGFKTLKYRVFVDAKPYKDIWLTTDTSIMRDVKDFMKQALKMNKKMEGCTQMGGVVKLTPELTDEYLELMEKGWTMKEVSMQGERTISEVESLEKRDIPATEFQVPLGYKKTDMKEMMGRMPR